MGFVFWLNQFLSHSCIGLWLIHFVSSACLCGVSVWSTHQLFPTWLSNAVLTFHSPTPSKFCALVSAVYRKWCFVRFSYFTVPLCTRLYSAQPMATFWVIFEDIIWPTFFYFSFRHRLSCPLWNSLCYAFSADPLSAGCVRWGFQSRNPVTFKFYFNLCFGLPFRFKSSGAHLLPHFDRFVF